MQKRFIQQNFSEVGLSPIVIVIIIALVLGGFLFYQKYPLHQGSAGQAQQAPTPTDETTNFKTYTNPELGYSFDYPADWEFTDRTDEDVASNQLQNAYLNYSGNSNLQDNEVSINVLKLPEHIIQRVKGGGGFGDAGMASEDIDTKIDNVNGKEVIKVHRKYSSLVNENEWKNTGENYLIYISLREGTYLILSSNIKTKDAVDKIFSTFKFLDQNQVDTGDWKTYENSRYKYSIKYPPDYKIQNTVSYVTEQPDKSPFMYVTKGQVGANICSVFATFIVVKNPASNSGLVDYSDRVDIKQFMSAKIGETVEAFYGVKEYYTRLDDKKVDGKNAFVFESKDNGFSPFTDHIIKRLIIDTKDYSYIIEGCLSKGSKEELKQYDQILSTFKFN